MGSDGFVFWGSEGEGSGGDGVRQLKVGWTAGRCIDGWKICGSNGNR